MLLATLLRVAICAHLELANLPYFQKIHLARGTPIKKYCAYRYYSDKRSAFRNAKFFKKHPSIYYPRTPHLMCTEVPMRLYYRPFVCHEGNMGSSLCSSQNCTCCLRNTGNNFGRYGGYVRSAVISD